MVHALGAVWMLENRSCASCLFPNASILSNMCFFVVMLCPVPIMFYIDSVQQERYRKVYHVAECITCVRFCDMHGLTATEYRRFYLDNVLVPP